MDCSITITPIFAVEKHGTNYKYVKILIADYPNTIFVVRNFVESYNSTPTKKPSMPYPGVSVFFDAEGRGIEQAACLCMGWAVLWLGHRLEKCCLRCLLAHQPSACLHCYAFPV